MTNEKTYCDPFNWVIKLNNKGTPFKNSAVSICCPHTEVKARNLAELLPIYYCAKYGGSFICACEANWFRQFGRSRLDQRLREASIAEKVCVACRGGEDIVKRYGGSLFSRRHWREISKRHTELFIKRRDQQRIEQNHLISLDHLLRNALWQDIAEGRFNKILSNPPLGLEIIEARNSHEMQFYEKARWKGVRAMLEKEYRKGKSILIGDSLRVLSEFVSMQDKVEVERFKLEREAENLVREARGIPLIGQGWVSETELFNLVKDVAGKLEVVQHARPPWLALQHLDVYVPAWSLAIEYQGEQHDQPISFFGGEVGLKKRKELDLRKYELCKSNSIRLIYFYPNDEMSLSAVEKAISLVMAES